MLVLDVIITESEKALELLGWLILVGSIAVALLGNYPPKENALRVLFLRRFA